MKNFTQILTEAKEKLEIQDETINKISPSYLNKYLEVASPFLSKESKDIINWLIDNPDYAEKLARKDADNALASFYDAGVPKDASLKDLYKNVGKVIKNNRMLEIPVFQTKEQFEGILKKTVAPDEIILDMSSEKGRNEIAKKYDPLVWKVARKYNGVSELSLEDLHSAGLAGLVYAMNTYGKKSDKSASDDENVKSFTFLGWAKFCIMNTIRDEIKHKGHHIRIPDNQQKKGQNIKTNAVSMETPMGKHKDGSTKTLGDKIDNGEYVRAGKNLDQQDIDNSWKDIRKALEEKFDEDTLGIFYSHFGLFGHKKLKGKQIMDKYGLKNQSNINATVTKVFTYIRKNKNLFDMFNDIYELMEECQHDDDMEERDNEPLRITGLRIVDESEI